MSTSASSVTGPTASSAAMVFIDTETCGLGWHDPIWEIAAIRRTPGLPDTEHHAFVDHDPAAATGLPEPFRSDHDARYDSEVALGHGALADWLTRVCAPVGGCRPVLLGAVPAFDAIRLIAQHGLDLWHYRWIDVETMAWTALHLSTPDANADALAGPGDPLGLPWKSDAVTTALGVPSVTDGRHTAMVDVRWARDTFDAVMALRPGLATTMVGAR